MQIPLQITFRNMDSSAAVEARLREEAAKLETFYDRIMSCRIVVEMVRHHSQRGKVFNIRIDLTVPGSELVVKHEPSLHSTAKHTALERQTKALEIEGPYKDIFVAIRDAFKTARRQLQDYARKQSGEVKQHLPSPEGKVIKLVPDEDFGFLQTLEGDEFYFHRNSVFADAFDQLQIGSVVTFVPTKGEKGPQASTVKPTGQLQRAGASEPMHSHH